MKIYIPTYGRASSQVTLEHLPPSVKKLTSLVVQDREQDLYDHRELGVEVIVLPKKIKTVTPTRDFIIDHHLFHNADPRLVMLDDDLRFYKRRVDDNTKFLYADAKDTVSLFRSINRELEKYAHVGVIGREGGNRVTERRVYNTRMMRVLAYRADIVKGLGIKFGDVKLQEDFHVTLSLLKEGYRNCVLADYCQGQKSSNADGGCSSYRSLELHNKCAEQLAKKHKPFVKVVTKKTKTAWGGEERKDVVVSWKKAFESGPYRHQY